MDQIERRQDIMKEINKKGAVKVKELAKAYSVGEATIRRDLKQLAEEDRLVVTYGGAYLREIPNDIAYKNRVQWVNKNPAAKYPGESNSNHRCRLQHSTMIKGQGQEQVIREIIIEDSILKDRYNKIVGEAHNYIQDGDTIAVGNGTLSALLLQKIDSKLRINLITPSLTNALIASDKPFIKIHVPGGILDNDNKILTGSQMELFIRQFNIDKVFVEPEGISKTEGITFSDYEELKATSLMIEQGKTNILLVESSKMNTSSFAKLEQWQSFDSLITDTKPDDEHCKFFDIQGIKLIC
ncbi:MAG: DeoR/GlpR family DNA-binding transcription regulator [Vallitaleaceae bacterium]|nr:DeoR/GlpR family DNA-binding transcription regulator [Vallitaleaceae bacterium]